MDANEPGVGPVHSPFLLDREKAAFWDVVSIEERVQNSTLVDHSVAVTEELLRAELPAEVDSFLEFISGKSPSWNPRIFRRLPGGRPTPDRVASILQIGEMYSKVFEVCPRPALQRAIEQYHRDEIELQDLVPPESPVMDYARRIIATVLGPAPTALSWDSGRFGPGAVAERMNHVDRFYADVPIQLASVIEPGTFPAEFGGRWVPSPPSRMVAVPKSFTKPRLIAAEPAWNGWFQQALGDLLRRKMRKYSWLDITNQDRNGFLSMNPDVATLDQSRASDRVSLELVRRLFPADWFELLDAVRTPEVECLCGSRHHLAKFAGMGAATTFPVETLVFAGIAVGAMLQADGLDGSTDGWKLIRSYEDRIGFYGDDAIVPVEYASAVASAYTACGFQVNGRKSYSSSLFRESCGVYSYDGVNVTPVRRHRLITGRRDAVSLASGCSFYNGLLLKHIYDYMGDSLLCKLFGRLAHSLGVDCLPETSYCVNCGGPKPTLTRLGPGFGLWDGDLTTSADWDSFPIGHYATLTGRRKRYEVTPDNASAVMFLCLSDLEGAVWPHSVDELASFGPVHKSLSQRFSPRPDTLRVRVR